MAHSCPRHVAVREQLVGSVLFLPWGSWGSDSGDWVWRRVCLLSEVSHLACPSLCARDVYFVHMYGVCMCNACTCLLHLRHEVASSLAPQLISSRQDQSLDWERLPDQWTLRICPSQPLHARATGPVFYWGAVDWSPESLCMYVKPFCPKFHLLDPLRDCLFLNFLGL